MKTHDLSPDHDRVEEQTRLQRAQQGVAFIRGEAARTADNGALGRFWADVLRHAEERLTAIALEEAQDATRPMREQELEAERVTSDVMNMRLRESIERNRHLVAEQDIWREALVAQRKARVEEQTPMPKNCPTCTSPAPHLHPAVQYEGEVQVCRDAWHLQPTNVTNLTQEALSASRDHPTPVEENQKLAQRLRDVLAEYAEDDTREAVERCEHCATLVLCSFHSVLSALSGRTTTTIELTRDHPTPEARNWDEILAAIRSEIVHNSSLRDEYQDWETALAIIDNARRSTPEAQD